MTKSTQKNIVVRVIVLALLGSGAFFLLGIPDSADKRSEETTLFAVGSYKEFLKETKNNKDPNSLYRQGIAAIKLGDFETAEEKLFQNLVHEKNNVTAALLKSLTLFNKNDPSGAISILSGIKTKNPVEKSVIQLMNGIYLLEDEKYSKAENVLISSQRADPTAPATPYFLAVAHLNNKKRSRSIEQVEKAKNLGYLGEQHYQVIAEAHFGMKNREEAGSAYVRLVKEGDESYQTLRRLGMILTQLGDDDEAIKTYDWIIKKYPEELQPYFRRAALLVAQQRYEEATKVYDVLETKVDDQQLIETRIEKLGLYDKQGKNEEKEELYNKIAANIGSDVGLNIQLAEKLLKVGMEVQAKTYIDAAIVKTPNNKKVRMLYRDYLILELLQSLRTQRDQNRVEEELLAVFPDDPRVKNFVILIYQQQGDRGAVLRTAQELERDVEGGKLTMMQLFFSLYEKQYEEATQLVGELDPDIIDIEEISLLQRYIAAAEGNDELQSNIIESISFKIPGLNQELVNDVFTKRFKDWLGKFDPYYDNTLLDLLPQ